jgi:hypothetical protein
MTIYDCNLKKSLLYYVSTFGTLLKYVQVGLSKDRQSCSLLCEANTLAYFSMGIIQLPFSTTRWQHGYRICFVILIELKIRGLLYNWTTTEAREKISTDLESLEFKKYFEAGLTKFKSSKILLNKFSHGFLATTMQCTRCDSHLDSRGRIFSRVQPFYERAVSDLDRSMHRYLWV